MAPVRAADVEAFRGGGHQLRRIDVPREQRQVRSTLDVEQLGGS